MSSESILEQQAQHYAEYIERHGPNWKGVDYSNAERVQLVFGQLTRIWDDGAPASVLDYGCGYGALLGYLEEKNFPLTSYVGFDVTAPMVEQARAVYGDREVARFVNDDADLEPADYVICAGVFNSKLDADVDEWHRHVVSCIERIWPLARKGLAFNMLTSYSEPEKMRSDLFYPDPTWFFDFCKRNLSRQVALMHDYGAWEFTMHVRR